MIKKNKGRQHCQVIILVLIKEGKIESQVTTNSEVVADLGESGMNEEVR